MAVTTEQCLRGSYKLAWKVNMTLDAGKGGVRSSARRLLRRLDWTGLDWRAFYEDCVDCHCNKMCFGRALSLPASAAAGWTNFGSIGEINQQPSSGVVSELVLIRVAVTTNPSPHYS